MFFFFPLWMFSYSSTICWKECSFSFELPLLICEKQVDYICVDAFLGSVCCFIDLFRHSFSDPHYLHYINNSSMQSWRQSLLSLLHFHVNLTISCQYSQNHLLGFQLGLHWIYRPSWEELTAWVFTSMRVDYLSIYLDLFKFFYQSFVIFLI